MKITFLISALVCLSLTLFSQLDVLSNNAVAIGVQGNDGSKLRVKNEAFNTALLVENLFDPSNSNSLYGIRNVMFNQGNVARRGIYSLTAQSETNSSGTYGIQNISRFRGISSNINAVGILNTVELYNTSEGPKYGLFNDVFAGGNGARYGIRNRVRKTITNPSGIFGYYGQVYAYGPNQAYGNYNLVYSFVNSEGVKFADYNYITANGSGNRYASYNYVNKSSYPGGTRYAVYGEVAGGNAYAGFFKGDLAYTGSIGQASDRSIKENILTLKDGISTVMQLRPSTYLLKESEEKRTIRGFIAQEVQEVLPELVRKIQIPGTPITKEIKDEEGNIIDEVIGHEEDREILGILPLELIPVLTKAIQEQQVLIEQLEKRISELEKR